MKERNGGVNALKLMLIFSCLSENPLLLMLHNPSMERIPSSSTISPIKVANTAHFDTI